MNFKYSVYLFLVLQLLILLLRYMQFAPVALVFLPIGCWLVLLVCGASRIQQNFFLNAQHRGSESQHRIALTFDDGPHPKYTPVVLDLLESYGIKATFFCIGNHIAKYPDLLKRINDGGHIIGNHSYSHGPGIDFGSKKQWMAEIEKTDALIKQHVGKKARFFRPPYGVTTPHLAKAIRAKGHQVIGWDVRPYDTSPQPTDRITQKILSKARPGSIILLHDTHERIMPVLEQLLPELTARNFNFVTVGQLIQQNPYEEI